MNNNEIKILEQKLKNNLIFWITSDGVAREVTHIGNDTHLEVDGYIREPGKIGFLRGCGFIALENCELRDFIAGHKLTK